MRIEKRRLPICARCDKKVHFGTVGKVYEGRFWANRTNDDQRWEANLCPQCQEDVSDFIDATKSPNATGVKKLYKDPMGG